MTFQDQIKTKENQIEQTLEGSFWAVSQPIFAFKFSFSSFFRGLQDYQSGFPIWEFFNAFAVFLFQIFSFYCITFLSICNDPKLVFFRPKLN